MPSSAGVVGCGQTRPPTPTPAAFSLREHFLCFAALSSQRARLPLSSQPFPHPDPRLPHQSSSMKTKLELLSVLASVIRKEEALLCAQDFLVNFPLLRSLLFISCKIKKSPGGGFPKRNNLSQWLSKPLLFRNLQLLIGGLFCFYLEIVCVPGNTSNLKKECRIK